MAVYVDRMNRRAFGLTFTAHMIADSTDELDAMADCIGMKRQWRQHSGTWREHYDLTESRRKRAVRYGAIEITSRELGHRLNRRMEESRHNHDRTGHRPR